MTVDHIVLPVSALKPEASRVFECLADGQTVYVSKQGDVVAGIRPFDHVPAEVAAAYVSPGARIAEVTAREMGRAVPSKAVSDAAVGLPSLVTKNHDIYGVLAAATIPVPAAAPDLEVAARRTAAVRSFLASHPEASVEEVTQFRSRWDSGAPLASMTAHETVAALGVAREGVEAELMSWKKLGSKVEALVGELFEKLTVGVLAPIGGVITAPSTRPDIGREVALWREHASAAFIYGESSSMAYLREGTQVARSNPVAARAHYVQALAATPDLNPGAMWMLGDLSRVHGHLDEAKTWYSLALTWDESLSGSFDLTEPATGWHRPSSETEP